MLASTHDLRPPPESGKIEPMSRRFQFSLKWLFVVVLFVATFFAAMAMQRQLDMHGYGNLYALNDQLIQNLKTESRQNVALRSQVGAQAVQLKLLQTQGNAPQTRHDQPIITHGPRLGTLGSASGIDTLTMPDGTVWFRIAYRGTPPTEHVFRGENGEKLTVQVSR